MIRVCERCGMYEAAQDDEWCDRCIVEVESVVEEVEASADERLLRHYYTPEDLELRVEDFEKEYGLPSEELLEMWKRGMKPEKLPHRDRHLWLSYFRELRERYRNDQ